MFTVSTILSCILYHPFHNFTNFHKFPHTWVFFYVWASKKCCLIIVRLTYSKNRVNMENVTLLGRHFLHGCAQKSSGLSGLYSSAVPGSLLSCYWPVTAGSCLPSSYWLRARGEDGRTGEGTGSRSKLAQAFGSPEVKEWTIAVIENISHFSTEPIEGWSLGDVLVANSWSESKVMTAGGSWEYAESSALNSKPSEVISDKWEERGGE